MTSAIWAKPRLAMFGIVLATVVLAVFTGLKSGAVPSLPGKVILVVTVPLVFGTLLGAIGDTRPLGVAASSPARGQTEGPSSDDGVERVSDEERVHTWRKARLDALGVPEEDAAVLAGHRTFSVHELEGLLEAGCPLGTALRILWPA